MSLQIVLIILSIIVVLFYVLKRVIIEKNVKKIRAGEFIEMSKNGEINKYTLVDVRTKREYQTEHLPGSTLKTLQTISSTSDLDNIDKSKPVILYCQSGARSMLAAQKFKKAGFDTSSLSGGVNALRTMGFNDFVK